MNGTTTNQRNTYLPLEVHEPVENLEAEEVPVSWWTAAGRLMGCTRSKRHDNLTFSMSLFVFVGVTLSLHFLSSHSLDPLPETPEALSSKDYFYYNLSCPLEWSKYSCAHQGQQHQAEESLQQAVQYKSVITQIFQTGLQPYSRMLLVGDSTMRQLIIAMGCVALAISPDVEYSVDWQPKWPCHGTPKCVRGGEHSGFSRASLRFPNGSEVHFVPLDGSKGIHEEKNIVSRFSEQIAQEGRITFGPNIAFAINPDSDAIYLNATDTLIFNIGLHNSLDQISGTLQEFVDFADALRFQRNRPQIVYLTSLTQHFDTSNGQFSPEVWGKHATCLSKIDANPRAELEREIVSGHVDQIIDYDDLAMGGLHIGGKDCTHYCMPGPPDYVAAQLVHVAYQVHKK